MACLPGRRQCPGKRVGLALGLGWRAGAKPTSGDGDDDENADVGDGADHDDDGDVMSSLRNA